MAPASSRERLPEPSRPAAAPLAPASSNPADGDAADENADAYSDLINEVLSLHEYKKKIEEECIARALRQTSGNITRAAALLKMKRPRLSQLVKEYGLSS